MTSFKKQHDFLKIISTIEKKGFGVGRIWEGYARAIEPLTADQLVLATVNLTNHSKRRWPALEQKIAEKKSDLMFFMTTMFGARCRNRACAEAHRWAQEQSGHNPTYNILLDGVDEDE